MTLDAIILDVKIITKSNKAIPNLKKANVGNA
jgi:hypothetical protein